MKRSIIIAFILCFILSGCGKPNNAINSATTDKSSTTSPTSQQSEQVSIQPSGDPTKQQNEPAAVQGAALLYADPELDIFLMVNSPDWTYTKQLYEGEVYFYPKDENPMTSVEGFAISSQQKGTYSIEETWGYVESSFKTSIPEFEWEQEDNINIGSYTGSRFHFSGTGIVGDYIIWETDKLQYICSFASDPNKYDEYYNMLAESLLSFKVLSEIES